MHISHDYDNYKQVFDCVITHGNLVLYQKQDLIIPIINNIHAKTAKLYKKGEASKAWVKKL